MCWICSLATSVEQWVGHATVTASIVGDRVTTDGGPAYAETNLDRFPVEPWSTGSALLFVAVAVYFLRVIRGNWSQYRFIAATMPIMVIGGIGSMLYHATRASRVFLLMDALPAAILVLAVTLFLWRAAWRHWRWMFVAVPAGVLLSVGLLRGFDVSLNIRITINYAILSAFVLMPTLIVLVRTRGAYLGWVLLALASITLGLWLRTYDLREPPLLPMGTHWLMHVFAAVAAFGLTAYVYRLTRAYALDEPGRLVPRPSQSAGG